MKMTTGKARFWALTLLLTVMVAGTIGEFPLSSQAASGEQADARVIARPMILLKGGAFMMGTAKASAHPGHAGRSRNGGANLSVKEPSQGGVDEDEQPVHRVTLSPFYLDATEVTNAEFARFVAATGHKTDAEKQGVAWVFKEGFKEWQSVDGADWRHPLGPDSSLTDKDNHPVVNVSWQDAAAYAKWAGKRLPTEAEWEYAARGGRTGEFFPWGNELKPNGQALANFWQGVWPEKNLLEDKFYYTAPVGSFQPNGFGLSDMIGNVWEWTADWYAADYYRRSPANNPRGPKTGEMRVARGGSWFCAENYCGAYRVGFRGQSPVDAGFNNVGFRCAKDARPVVAPTNKLTARNSAQNVRGQTVAAAPAFSLKTLAGKELRLSDFAGRVVVLNFWATWCAPCQMETPWLVELHQRYQARGVEIIAVSVDALDPDYDARDVRAFVKEHKVKYPIVLATQEVVEAYGPISGIPATIVIDRAGQIHARHRGLIPFEKLEHEIKGLL